MGGVGGRAPDFEGSMNARASAAGGRNRMSSPQADATNQSSWEKTLADQVKRSETVNSSGASSAERTINIPKELDRGSTCEVIPSQDLKAFSMSSHKEGTHNKIKVFSAGKHPSSEEFLRTHGDAVESFAVLLERLCTVFGLPLRTIAIFYDPTGGTIAFNSNRSLHFNVRFFFALHYTQNLHQSRSCYGYWYIVCCHELTHVAWQH